MPAASRCLRIGSTQKAAQRSGQTGAARQAGGTRKRDRSAEVSEGRHADRRVQAAACRCCCWSWRRRRRRWINEVLRSSCWCFVAVAAWPRSAARLPRRCERHGKRAEATACFQKLTGATSPAVARRRLLGTRDFKDANDAVPSSLSTQQPKNADLRVRWGRLFLERFNPAEAQQLFKEALEHRSEARRRACSAWRWSPRKASTSRRSSSPSKALEIDPKLVEAQELLAQLALEDNNTKKAIEEADKALKMSPEALDAMAVRLRSICWTTRQTSEWFGRITAINPVYGEAWAFAGHIPGAESPLRRRHRSITARRLELDPELAVGPRANWAST